MKKYDQFHDMLNEISDDKFAKLPMKYYDEFFNNMAHLHRELITALSIELGADYD